MSIRLPRIGKTLAGASWVAALLLATAAQAATIHYNFENTGTLPVAPTDNDEHGSLGFTRGGVAVTVTAVARSSDAGAYAGVSGTDRGVYFGDTGLGVVAYGNDSNNMDGANEGATDGDLDEGLVFTFDRVVRLTDINFGRWDNGLDAIRFLVDGVQVLLHSGSNDAPSGLNFVGTEFRFLAENDDTGVRIQDLDIETVPLPGTPALLAAALLALGLTRRRVGG
jgi:hypothetical protein